MPWTLEANIKGPAGVPGGAPAWHGAWQPGTAYSANDAVSYQGSSYYAPSAIAADVVPPAAPWQTIAEAGAQGPAGATGAQGPPGPQGDPGLPATLGPTLTTIEALTGTANTGLYFTGTDVAALFPLTAFARTLLDDPDQATAQATLGVTTYTDEQAQDAVGAMLVDTATIDLTYDDATPSLTGIVKDASITEAKLVLADVTTQDVSTTRHGLVPKAPNVATQYLDGTGAWSTPAGGAASFLALTDTPDAYAGHGGKVVAVNSGATALEFITDTGAAPLGAVVQRVATQSITQNSNTAVIWDTETRDDNGYWTSGAPTRLTVPVTGWHSITAFIQWDATTGVTRIVNARVNGTAYIAVVSEGNAGVDQRQTVAVNWYLTAGDYVEIILFQSTAGARLITGNASIVAMTAAPAPATTFLALTDTPDTYSGQGGNLVTVNSGATALDYTPLTAAGRALLDDADTTAQRTTLGLGTMATQNAGAVAITGGSAAFTGAVSSTETISGSRGYYAPQNAADNTYALYADRTAGGTGRYNLNLVGTAPNYLAGPLGLRAQPQATVALYLGCGAGIYGLVTFPTSGTDAVVCEFRNQALTAVGSIYTGATSTAYNTTSDRRLKRHVQPLTDSLALVGRLKPISHLWTVDDSYGEGFLADELQREVPLAVTGEPDAVNDDGSVKPQQVDASKLIPRLTAALQEVAQRLDALEARLDAGGVAHGL